MQVHIFDIILAGWMALFAINGYLNGFWNGMFSIIKWIITISIFYFGYPIAESVAKKFFSGELNVLVVSSISLFVISLLFASWISDTTESIIHTSSFIKFLNKLLGLFLGIAKGSLAIIVIISIMSYLEIKTDWIEGSKSGKKVVYASNQLTNNVKFDKISETISKVNFFSKVKDIEIVS